MISILFCQVCGAANESTVAYCFSCGQYLAAEQEHMDEGNASLLHGRYQLGELLGSGGFSVVYRARDTREDGRPVAIKQINLQGLSAEEAIEATDTFNREVSILSTLSHPQVPLIYDHFRDQDHWYLVLEYVAGRTLESHLATWKEQGKHLSLEEILSMGLQLCRILKYLHNRQPPLIYRDLKPSNIMRTLTGTLYLIDFGIARHFRPGQGRDTQPLGSPGYAAPEQYGRAQTTPQADIYSLGALLYQLLSGYDPSDNPGSLPPLHLDHQAHGMELAGLVTRMLSPNPIARPGSVQAVAEELNRIKQRIDIQHNVSHIWKPPTPQGYPRISLPPVPPAPPKRFTRRKALAIAGIGTLATGMICAGTSFLLGKLWDGLSTASDDIYAGHSGPVYNIAWHAHDMYMASASADRTVQVIDLGGDPDAHGNNLSSSYRHKGAVNGVSWSPDGKYFVLASADGTVQISSITNTIDAVLTYTGHTGEVRAVAWSPDGKKIVSASTDGSVQVWDAQTGKTLTTIKQAGAIYTVAWSIGGDRIAFGGAQKNVFVWNPIDGHIISTYRGHKGAILSLAWSPMSDEHIVSASADGTAQISNASDESHVFTGHRLRMPPFSNAGRKQAFLVGVGQRRGSLSGSLPRKKKSRL
ncbi:serine/threonine-protein kinase [Ktedonobacter racemifer]|uniref:Serine/threonine protein kinase with WD40 repeats n=1 Tax=Ktedonobacter racemifer DSM 44963 TaxID=485913 RepID=D6U5U2_KTERA|nr:serine/threonine-protein kinase [Ktedonobacter racemifer]EFH80353.1 serine/threonine protein kinase with WD40 repeats [Ktedonobacter racemifer DSM 44963]